MEGLATNLRFIHDELDILALSKCGRTLAIVEVRSTRHLHRLPERTIDRKKRKALSRVARQLLTVARKHGCTLRIDVLAVRIMHNTTEIRHYEGAIPFKQ